MMMDRMVGSNSLQFVACGVWRSGKGLRFVSRFGVGIGRFRSGRMDGLEGYK